ncbi:MAG: CapA family protein [Clostridia bacterium]|nr:CapA family protein [Clostridia bacterium]
MKKILTMGALLILFLFALVPAQAEMRGFVKGDGYVYVNFGEYPYEKDGTVRPVLWRVLDVQDNRALLLTEYLIDTDQIIFVIDQKVIEDHSYRRISTFEESDLFPKLSTEYLDRLLGSDPLRNALIPEANGATVFLLNDKDYMNIAYGFENAQWAEWPNRIKSHEAQGTPYAIKQRGLYVAYQNDCSPYWVATVKSNTDYKLQIVGFNGHLSWGAYTRVNIGLRLSVRLDLNQLEITGGAGTKQSPYTFAYTGSSAAAQPASAAQPAETEQPVETEQPAPVYAPAETAAPVVEPQPAAAPVVQQPLYTLAPDTPPSYDRFPTYAPLSTDVPKAQTNSALLYTLPPATPSPTTPPTQEPALEPTAEPAAAEKNTVTLSFVGDCSIGDSAQYTTAKSSYHTCLKNNGYAWPFSLVKNYLESDDLTVANLEVVFTTRTNHADKTYYLKGDPAFVQVLTEGSIEMVNTVNNHCMDFMDGGYTDSLATLDSAGIKHFGTINPGLANSHDDLGLVEVDGIMFGFIGWSYPQEYDLKNISNRILMLRSQGAEVVVVSLHWGRETYMTPESWQATFAKNVLDAGADMIWGHHPHVIQPIGIYQGKPILFSTGNFTFGTMSDVNPATGIFQVTYEKTESGPVLKELKVIPCTTQRSPDFRPKELTEQKDRLGVFKYLTFKKAPYMIENPPASFLETGVIQFENGQMVQ